MVCALVAGLIFNISNTLLVVGINIAGMAVAFPLAIGLALAVGTVLTYIVQPTADPCLMFPGVGFGVLAVISMGVSYHFLLRAKAAIPAPLLEGEAGPGQVIKSPLLEAEEADDDDAACAT